MPRRVWIALVVAGLVAAPALVLRGLCAGRACATPARASARVPFCSLPSDLRELVRRGFRDGRSPEVLAVTGATRVSGGSGVASGLAAGWPSAAVPPTPSVVVFAGRGVRGGVTLPDGFGLDDVAPTLAEVLALDRPHPEVRSGRAAPGVATGSPPRLVLEVVWEGMEQSQLERRERWPYLARLLRAGASTMSAGLGSLPQDPAALLASIGTGGVPAEHGVTGSFIRADDGSLVSAWSRRAPTSVIATLGDDLDERMAQRPRVGLVAPDLAGRGLVGGDWYVGNDRDDLVLEPRRQLTAAARLLGAGYGRDVVPDLLAVVARGRLPALDAGLERLVEAARRVARGSVVVVVVALGRTPATGLGGGEVARSVDEEVAAFRPVVEAAVTGGLYLDQGALSGTATTEKVVRALRRTRTASGARVFADAFPALAVTFARYCS